MSDVQVSYDLAREDSDLTTVTVTRVFENGFKVLLHLQGDDAVAFIDAWNARPATLTPAKKCRTAESLLTRDHAAPRYMCSECAHDFTWEVSPTNCPECGGRLTDDAALTLQNGKQP